jgi:hypothetical protein
MISDLPPDPFERECGSVMKGIAFGMMASFLGCTVLAMVLGFGSSSMEWLFVPLFFVGITQLLWIVPMVLQFRRKGQPETAKGLVIVAALVALLNASCWGLLGNFRIAG